MSFPFPPFFPLIICSSFFYLDSALTHSHYCYICFPLRLYPSFYIYPSSPFFPPSITFNHKLLTSCNLIIFPQISFCSAFSFLLHLLLYVIKREGVKSGRWLRKKIFLCMSAAKGSSAAHHNSSRILGILGCFSFSPHNNLLVNKLDKNCNCKNFKSGDNRT